ASPVGIAELEEVQVNVDRAPAVATVEAPVMAPAEVDAGPNASAVLPGFVDYLIANPTLAVAPVEESAPAPLAATEVVAETAARAEFAVEAHAAVEASEPVAIAMAEAPADTQPAPVSTALEGGAEIGAIPTIDPALEMAPPVAITPTPDPQFEAPAEIAVANATEDGLQPTSRAEESAGVPTTTDPNLSPMIGLVDTAQPLEGGRFVVPEAPAEAAPTPEPQADAPVESAGTAEPPVTEAAPVDATPVEPPVTTPSKKSKKGKEMRPIPATPAVAQETPAATAPVIEPAASTEVPAPVATETSKPAPKAEVSEEIAAVLSLLGQTAGTT